MSSSFNCDQSIEELLAQPGSCLVHEIMSTSASNRQLVDRQKTVYACLARLKRRPILESELGFAVVYVSTDRYCNPRRRCPKNLYQEAGVSQAFSVNPFNIESQSDSQPTVTQPITLPADSLDRPSDLSDPNENVDFKKPISNLLPPKKLPANRKPKAILLIPDSEPLTSPPRTVLGVKQSCTNRQQLSSRLDSESLDESKDKSSHLIPGLVRSETSSLRRLDLDQDDDDPFADLNSMPSLSTHPAEEISQPTQCGDTSSPIDVDMGQNQDDPFANLNSMHSLSTQPVTKIDQSDYAPTEIGSPIQCNAKLLDSCHQSNEHTITNDATIVSHCSQSVGEDEPNVVTAEQLPVFDRWLTKKSLSNPQQNLAEKEGEAKGTPRVQVSIEHLVVQPSHTTSSSIRRPPLDDRTNDRKVFRKVVGGNQAQIITSFHVYTKPVEASVCRRQSSTKSSLVDQESDKINRLFDQLSHIRPIK